MHHVKINVTILSEPKGTKNQSSGGDGLLNWGYMVLISDKI
nr:MAG TPA: hypothetical protein [Bacteriophage sp.]